jgi:hypothetical protein
MERGLPWWTGMKLLGDKRRDSVVPKEAARPVADPKLRLGFYDVDVDRILEALAGVRRSVDNNVATLVHTNALAGETREGIDTYTKVLADAVEYIKKLYAAIGELQRVAVEIKAGQAGIEAQIRRAVADAFDTYAGELISQQDAFLARIEKMLARQPQGSAAEVGTQHAPNSSEAPLASEIRPEVQSPRPETPAITRTRDSALEDRTAVGSATAAPRQRSAGPARLSPDTTARLVEMVSAVRPLLSQGDPAPALSLVGRLTDLPDLPQWYRDKLRQLSKAIQTTPERASGILDAISERLVPPTADDPDPLSPAGVPPPPEPAPDLAPREEHDLGDILGTD